MKRLLLLFFLLVNCLMFSQASSQMNNALNTNTGLNPPNIVYTLAPPASTWQQTSTANLNIAISQVTGLQADLNTKLTSETDPLFDTKFSGKTTSNLTEGSNLYWTISRFNTAFTGKTTTDLTEGTNLYFTTSRARNSISATGNINYNPASGIISEVKRRETSSGTTNASGQYTFTFANTYSVAPNIQSNIINGTDSQIIRIGTPTTTSVTVTVRNRTDVVGLLPTWSNVNGATVDILVTEK